MLVKLLPSAVTIRDQKIALAYHERITSLAQNAHPYEPDGCDNSPQRIPCSQLQAQHISNLLQDRLHRQLEKNPLITPFPLPPQKDITMLFLHDQCYLPVHSNYSPTQNTHSRLPSSP